jgi:hypothetical protein
MTRYLLGPELYWLLFYTLAVWFGRFANPYSKAVNDFVEVIWCWIPVAGLLVFGLWWIPATEKNWLLLRVWISGIFGWHYVLERVLRDFQKSGPGVGTAYLVSFILQLIFMVAGSIFVVIKF